MKAADLKPAGYNPRRISKSRLDALERSMREFGDLSGIVFNRKTKRLVGGHQRLKNLQSAWPIVKTAMKDKTGTVAVGYVDTPDGRWSYREVDWDEAKEKAANIAANAAGGDFDDHKLRETVLELGALNFDLDLLNLTNLDNILGMKNDTANDAPAPPKVAVTKLGDLYQLGPHRVLCGDSTKAEDVERLMGEAKLTVCFTDPPYGVSIGKKNVMLNTFQRAGRCLENLEMDDMKPAELGDMLLKAFTLWRTVMAEDCAVFVCSPQGGGLGMMMMMMRDAGLEVRHILNWIKNSPTFSMGRLDYDYQHEPILFTWTKTHKRRKAGAFTTSLWAVDKPMANKYHPTMKPVELPTCAILNHSDKGDVVGDPFLGSGTTLVAAEQNGRVCYGMEISPIYCDVIIKRWEGLTGKKAEKLS